jgi:hypothetical protein
MEVILLRTLSFRNVNTSGRLRTETVFVLVAAILVTGYITTHTKVSFSCGILAEENGAPIKQLFLRVDPGNMPRPVVTDGHSHGTLSIT